MSRTCKLIVIAAIVEMALVALAIFAWKSGAFPGLPAPRPIEHPHQFILFFAPVWFALGSVYAARRLASDRPRISDNHRRYLEGSLKAGAALIAATQGFFAYADITGAMIDKELAGRGLAFFLGLWLTIHGNAAAKLDPPSGEGAPSPSVWTRMLLRFGWIMVALGLGLVLCALALPDLRLLLTVMIVISFASLALEFEYRRMTRPSRAA